MASISWRMIAGAQFGVPARGSTVRYLPDVHRAQSSGVDPAAHPNLDMETARTAVVDNIEFLFNPLVHEHILVRFTLRPTALPAPPLPDSQRLEMAGTPIPGTLDEEKTLTARDVERYRYHVNISVPIIQAFFPENIQSVIRYTDGTELDYLGRYNGYIRKGWNRFHNEKRLVAGDVLILARTGDDPEVKIGVRRMARHIVDGQQVVDALQAHAAGNVYTVDYYPTGGNAPFVVLAP